MFLSSDLQPTVDCFPLEFVVRKGWHRVVRMERRMRSGRRLPLAEDKFEDEDGNFFYTYPLQDNPQIAMLLLGLPTFGRSHKRQPSTRGNTVRRRRGCSGAKPGLTKGKCSICKLPGHNRQTCP